MTDRGEQAGVADVMLEALGGKRSASTDRVDLRRLTRVAVWHGVEGYVLAHLLARGHDRATLCDLEVACRTTAVSHLRKVADLKAVQEALSAASIAFLVVKGPVVAESLHGSASLRGYGDLDVVVAPADLRGAVKALEAAGVEMIDRNWDRVTRERRGQCHMVTGRDTVIDLHWHLVNEVRLRSSLDLRTEHLFERATTVAVGPLRVSTTDAADTLIHLSLHATLSGGDRLIWFKDIERAVVATQDWDDVIRRANAWGSGLLVGGALEGAVRLLDAPVPAEVLAALAPSRVWRWVNVAGARLSPPEQLHGEGAVYRMIGRSTRRDLGSSVAELGRRGAKHLLPGAEEVNDIFDPSLPDSLHRPTGDREDFFALVEQEAAPRAPR
jgi:hypothetical protein